MLQWIGGSFDPVELNIVDLWRSVSVAEYVAGARR